MSINETDEAMIAIGTWHLGKTSAKYESGGRKAGVISTGKGDHGGASYGTYQLSSKTGTLSEYLQQSRYKNHFDGLILASSEFNAKWIELANADPGFGQDQHEFIKRTHYDVQNEKLKSAGLDLSNRSRPVQDALWSTSVQFRHKTKTIFIGGLEEKFGKNFDIAKISDKEIVEAVQDYKIAHNNSLFKSSPNLWRGLLRRANDEKSELSRLADHEQVLARQNLLPDWRHSINAPHSHIPFRGIPYAPPGNRPLQLGNEGFDVARLQENLKQLGMVRGDGGMVTATGHFDVGTKEAVEFFQRQYNLPTTGIADRTTLAAMQVGVNAVHSIRNLSLNGEPPRDDRSDWLVRRTDDAPNHLHTSNLASQTPAPYEVVNNLPHAQPATLVQSSYLPPDVVRTLQTQLNGLHVTDANHRQLAEDGHYGPRTREAVAKFQKQEDLPITDVADDMTRAAVNARFIVAELERNKAEREEKTEGFSNPSDPDRDIPSRASPMEQSPRRATDMLDYAAPGQRPFAHEPASTARIDDDIRVERSPPVMSDPNPVQRQLAQLQQEMDALRRQMQHPPQPREDSDIRIERESVPPAQRTVASEPAAQRTELLPYRDPRHPDHRLYAELKERLPQASEDRLVQFTAACHIGGIKPDQLGHIVVRADKAVMTATWPPGTVGIVDMTAPVPSQEESMLQVRAHDQQLEREHAQRMEQRLANERAGPVMQ